MEFIWHDGGRAAAGFVGLTGDCATRAIAIATGQSYRDVYQSLAELGDTSPRNGVELFLADDYLASRGWRQRRCDSSHATNLPKGAIIVHFRSVKGRYRGHLCGIVDHVVYDTWNPCEDTDFAIDVYWTRETTEINTLLSVRPGRSAFPSDGSAQTQDQYDRIVKRLRALQNTADNHASTEGEVHNALRAIQALMFQHNLTREDIAEKDDTRVVGMTRRVCPVNGKCARQWESSLAWYVVSEVFPLVQYYQASQHRRTMFWFYGPVNDVEQAMDLFREILSTIAASAVLKYGSFSRGSGASYAEGYVAGLPRSGSSKQTANAEGNDHAIIQCRALAVRSAAKEWLKEECGITIHNVSSGSGRWEFDWSAHRVGTRDGASHNVARVPATRLLSHNATSP